MIPSGIEVALVKHSCRKSFLLGHVFYTYIYLLSIGPNLQAPNIRPGAGKNKHTVVAILE